MIVALTAWNRIEYLSRVLDSIDAAAGYVEEEVVLVAHVEPSEMQNHVLDLLGRGRGRYVTLNHERVGHVRNIRETFEDAFSVGRYFNDDFVVHFPDDILLAPDAFQCLAYIRDTFRDAPRVLCSSLFSKNVPEEKRWREVAPTSFFNSQGFGTWRDKWHHFSGVWEPVEEKREWGQDPEGYRGIDRSIREDLLNGSETYLQMRPILSRVNHIGLLGGQHTTPDTFDNDAPDLFAADVPVDFEEAWWHQPLR